MDKNNKINVCALRFDGYKYQKQTGFNPQEATTQYLATRKWDLEPLEKLATFFFLQRSLNKFDLQYEPRDGQYWQALESLFDECKDLEIPEEYRQNTYYEAWKKNSKS
ncbi:hypothetical protein [Fischerella thermalis]|uniref:hypothetical protein n=1 Tax=Fischerella thermalis TaxID=372787 RepID=UPI00030809D9|nr:hypothetical protein [Fischerella thermalis]